MPISAKHKPAASVRFIFTTIFLDALGLGIIIPILPDLIRRFAADPTVVSEYFGYFISVYALMQFVASPVLGSLSDRYGRRPVILSSLLGAAIDYAIMAFAPNLLILFIGRVIAGLTGASYTVATAYMADISTDETRPKNFGLIGAAFGLGFIVGPVVGGFVGHYGSAACFMTAALLNLLNFVFGYLVLPESLGIENRREVNLKRLNPFRSLGHVLRPSPILALVWVYFLIFLAGHVHMVMWALYTQYRFGWSPLQVGASLSIVGLTIAVVQGGLTGVIVRRIGEARALWFGLIVNVIASVAYAFASAGWMIYAILLPSSLGGVANPALQSLMTKRIPANEQGEFQGSIVSLGSITAIIGPILYTEVFAYTSGPHPFLDFPGAVYIVAALVTLLALVMSRGALRSE